MKKMLFAAMIGAAMSLASCSNNDEPENPSSKTEISETEMTVSGTWQAGTEISLDRHLVIPEGESLTIEPGVKVIVSTAGVGINHTPIEIIVKARPLLCRRIQTHTGQYFRRSLGRYRSRRIVPGNGDRPCCDRIHWRTGNRRLALCHYRNLHSRRRRIPADHNH